MSVVYARCCGLDVHKLSLTACVLIAEAGTKEKRLCRFGTMTADILRLAAWLTEHGVMHLAMESTGVYWKPVWTLLEGRVEILLVNATHIKTLPGRKQI